MIALLIAAVSSASGTPGFPLTAVGRCVGMAAGCDGGDDWRYRLRSGDARARDSKMDAYRVNARPCRLIGDMRCPGKTREIWRSGEPLKQTLSRSFSLR